MFQIFGKRNTRPSQPIAARRLFNFNNAGKTVTQETSMRASAYYRGLIYLSSQIAKLPCVVKDAQRNDLWNHRVTTLMNTRPNPELTAMRFKLFMVQVACNYGNAYAEIERNLMGEPVALWPLLPGHVAPIRDENDNLVYSVYGATSDGGTVYMSPRDIYHIPNLHTTDGLMGMSIIDYARDILGITIGADEFANSLYANGAMPSGVLEVPSRLDDESARRLKESWDNSHGGRKVGGTAVLEEGIKYQSIMMSPDVLQFIDSRKFNVYDIARFIGVPPQKLFDTESQKFKNVEQANIQVANDTIDPWTRIFEQEADAKLLNNNRGGKFLQFNLYDLFRGDMDTRSSYYKNMFGIGAITPNQIREKEGEAPYKDGDKYYIATNNYTPMNRIDEVIDSQVKPKEPNELQQAAAKFMSKR